MQAERYLHKVRWVMITFVGMPKTAENERRALLRLQEFLVPALGVRFIDDNAEICMRDGTVLTLGEFFGDPS